MSRIASLVLLVGLASPVLRAQAAGSPSATPAQRAQSGAIRAGTYTLAITFGGGVTDGELTISFKGDSLAALLHVGGHESPVKAGERRGSKLVLEPRSPAMPVRYELEFRGDEVSGTFTYQGEPGTVTGKRRAAER